VDDVFKFDTVNTNGISYATDDAQKVYDGSGLFSKKVKGGWDDSHIYCCTFYEYTAVKPGVLRVKADFWYWTDSNYYNFNITV
jgi:hypothetical protein